MRSNSWIQKFGSVVGLAGLAAAIAATPVSAGTPALDKCQKAIDKEGIKLVSALEKALEKCKDAYTKEVVKNGTLADINTVATKCQDTLVKTYLFPDPDLKSKKAKAFIKLADPVKGLVAKAKCDDALLQQLGHLPEATFDDTWARWILIAKEKAALYDQIWLVRTTVNIFQNLYNTGNCDLCKEMSQGGPCFEHSCILDGASASNVKTQSLTIPVALTGTTILEVCDAPNVLADNYALVGATSKGITPVEVVPGALTACVTAIGGEGYITQTGSALPKVNYSTCQDHVITAGVDDCLGPLPSAVCSPQMDDMEPAHVGIVNGGGCVQLSSAASAAGDTFFLNTTQITIVNVGIGEEAGDGIPCTKDDLSTPAVPATIPLTTGTADSQVLNVDTTGGSISAGPIGGTKPTVPALVPTSVLSGLKLVGAFPALDALDLGGPTKSDTVTTFTLSCQ